MHYDNLFAVWSITWQLVAGKHKQRMTFSIHMYSHTWEVWECFWGGIAMNDEVSQVADERWNIVDKISSLMLSFYDCNCSEVFSKQVPLDLSSFFWATMLWLCESLKEYNIEDEHFSEKKTHSLYLTWLLVLPWRAMIFQVIRHVFLSAQKLFWVFHIALE